MLSLVKQERVVFGAWKLLTLAGSQAAESVSLPVGALLVPVCVWHARRRELVEREYAHGWPLGVWLASGENPGTIADDLDDFSAVAVHFPKATDGRGCFAARLLRGRYGYRGELRAFGALLREQVFYLRHSGFDAFTLCDAEDARAPAGVPRAFDQRAQAQPRQPLRLVPRCPESGPTRFATAHAA